jgi:Galactose oxidase-like, Early set domain/PKD domain/Bacterial Ig domain
MKLNFSPVPGRKSQGRCAPGAAVLYAGAVLAAIFCASTLRAHEPKSQEDPQPVFNEARIPQAAPVPQSVVTDGSWETLSSLMPINPIHVNLLHDGQILVVAGSENNPPEHEAGEYYAAVWNTQTGTITVQTLLWDLFCNGMLDLGDGRPIIVGGSSAVAPPYGDYRASIFDPATEKFNEVESMAHGRWYATLTNLGDGTFMAFSGLEETGGTAPDDDGGGRAVVNKTVEFYTVGSGWSTPYTAPWIPPLYPRLHLLPNGKVFCSGEQRVSTLFTPSTQTWTLNYATTVYTRNRRGGSSVLLPLSPATGYAPKVMIMGGDTPNATASSEIIDLSAATPAWRSVAPMSLPRTRMNAVILPTGKILALGGSAVDEDGTTASLAADLFDPATETWTSAGVATYARLYHSCALLIPDGTVEVVGSNPVKGTYEHHIELYSPAYLFAVDQNGNVIPAVRPTITSAPAKVGYGSTFTIQTPDYANISSAVLVRDGSSTHAFDFEQRLIELSFTVADGALTATAPPTGFIAPPGYYMLFILNQSGVPSVAQFIQLSLTPTDLPPKGSIDLPTGDVTITEGDSVNFAGSATDPDNAVASYAWIFPEGVPESSSVPNPGLVSFGEAGTYVVSMTAIDASGANDPSPPTRTIIVQSNDPIVLSFTKPKSGALVHGRQISISLSATNTQGSSNTFTCSVDGTQIGTTTVSGTTAAFTWRTKNYALGAHTLSATVTDSNGRTGTATEPVTLQ